MGCFLHLRDIFPLPQCVTWSINRSNSEFVHLHELELMNAIFSLGICYPHRHMSAEIWRVVIRDARQVDEICLVEVCDALSMNRMTNFVLQLPVGPDTIKVKGCLKGNMIVVDFVLARCNLYTSWCCCWRRRQQLLYPINAVNPVVATSTIVGASTPSSSGGGAGRHRWNSENVS